ncbi:MAG: glycosyltransferase family 9 protein [Candidatus Firestonebacteria bacterium]
MKEDIKRILIIRLRYVGDLVLTTPLIRSLKTNFPESHLSYMAEPHYLQILKENPYIDELIPCEKKTFMSFMKTLLRVRSKKFDLAIDLFGNPRSALISYISGANIRVGFDFRFRKYAYNRVVGEDVKDDSKKDALDVYEQVLNTIGVRTLNRKTEIFLSKEEEKRANIFLKSKGLEVKNDIIGINPGGQPARRWPKEKFAELGDRIIRDGKTVLLFSGPNEKELSKDIYNLMKRKPILADELNLRELAAVINTCKLFVTNNTGAFHISVALGIPTIAIFRAKENETWFPYKDDKFVFISKDVECWPCHKNFCDDLKCMKLISVDEVEDWMLGGLESQRVRGIEDWSEKNEETKKRRY